MFLTSHAAGSPAEAVFSGFNVTASETEPALGAIYPAAASVITLAGCAVVQTCGTRYCGEKPGYVGEGGTSTFKEIAVKAAGMCDVTIV